MGSYVDQNCSITVTYDSKEIPGIIGWLKEHWEDYVGVSFLLRPDYTKTAKDLGYAYMPQEVVTKEAYELYVSTLKPVELSSSIVMDIEIGQECSSGACPLK